MGELKTKTAEASGMKPDMEKVNQMKTLITEIFQNKRLLLQFNNLCIKDAKDTYGEVGGYVLIALTQKGTATVKIVDFENTDAKEIRKLIEKIGDGTITVKEFKKLADLTSKYATKVHADWAEEFNKTNRVYAKLFEKMPDFFKTMKPGDRKKFADAFDKVIQPFLDARIPASPEEMTKKLEADMMDYGDKKGVLIGFHIHSNNSPPSPQDLEGSSRTKAVLAEFVISYDQKKKIMTVWLTEGGKSYLVGKFNPLKEIKPAKQEKPKEEGWLLRMRNWFLEHRKKE